MKHPMTSHPLFWLGIGILAVGLLAGLSFIFRSVPEGMQSGQAIVSSPIETPATAEIPWPVIGADITVLPAIGPDGKPLPPPPTFTPFPTPTPRPTPTRRPGPTVTPFPTRAPASNAAGGIYYLAYEAAQEENTLGKSLLFQLSLGVQAEKLTESVRVPISQPEVFGAFAPSPDGRYLLLLQRSMPGGTPHIIDRETNAHWSLAPEGEHESGLFFGWHPNSRQILFWNDRDQLLVIDVESRERTILGFMIGPVQGAAFSPDGQNIAYSSYLKISENQAREALWTTSIAGSDAHSLFTFDAASYVFNWSPDSRYILYMGGPGVGRTEEPFEEYATQGPLWLVEPDGENPSPLAGSFIGGSGYEPAWSPDSQWITFTGLDEGREYGCFSPDKSKKIDWPTCEFVGTGVYIENVQSGELRRLASGIRPVWSPDGKWVAFLSNVGGASDIWVVQTDGSNLHQVTTDGLMKTEIIWMFREESKH